ncbi:Fic/DOC family N-terminal domain-containing protein [Nocardia sp. NPDC050378]
MLKAAISANRALAQLDQAALAMPNPTVLINTIRCSKPRPARRSRTS